MTTRLLIDALTIGYGGARTYLLDLLPRLAAYPLELHVLLSPAHAAEFQANAPKRVRWHFGPRPLANPFSRYGYQRYGLPRLAQELRADVLFVPGGLTGFRATGDGAPKLVTVIQNMLPFEPVERRRYALRHYPKMRLRLWLLSRGLRRTLRRADRVIFISEHSARRVLSRVPVLDHRIIPHGIPERFRHNGTDGAAVLARHGLRRPYLLYVSILDPYKHQDRILEGFERFMAETPRDLEMVFAGPVVGAYGRRIRAMAAQARSPVRCLDHVPPEDLPDLLRRAEALLFGSTCECCPFILLEYLAAGRPIVCSDKPPMPELAGEGALYVPALEPAAWAEALHRLFGEPGLGEALAVRAQARSRALDWESAARRTYAALTEW